MNCHACKKPITDSYVQDSVGETVTYYHRECRSPYLCEICGDPILTDSYYLWVELNKGRGPSHLHRECVESNTHWLSERKIVLP